MWIAGNFKPIGRLQRGEYLMRSLVLMAQCGFWLLNLVMSGIGAVAMSGSGQGKSMQMTFLVVLCFGLLIAYQGFVLTLRRLQDIGINPVFAIAGYALFWLAEYAYFSTIPEMAVTIQGIPLPMSWLGVAVPTLVGFALMLLPSAPEGMGYVSSDGEATGTSWADAIKIPTAAAAAPASPATGERRRAPRGNATGKPQFGNRPARQP